MERKWELAEPAAAEQRERFPELHPVTLQLLANRNLVTQEEVDEFLYPDYGQDLHDPGIFRQMEPVCERLLAAVGAGERITVYGDYDADGVTSTAIMLEVLRELAGLTDGGEPERIGHYIPHRESEGYGLHRPAVEKLAADGCQLIVTVDCGVSNADEVERAQELGVEVIVVDHHKVPERVPDCLIVHPMAPDEKYPFKRLAAAGVAFKLACALLDAGRARGLEIPEGREKWLLDLVAIATVTDFMPLLGENRTLEKYGLVVLNKTRRPGLQKLIEVAGLEPGKLDTVSVGYYVGPRINAASRMDHADLALDTLMADTPERAAELARQLNLCNAERQRQTQTMAKEALEMVDRSKFVQVLYSESWSPGIVGIVAGKLVSEVGVPAFVLG
ncbi:DHH family phosphoesterase, partial [Patescibacteria group bacterium]